MARSTARIELENLALSQWGMFTAAQASAFGFRSNQIVRMVDSGRVEPRCYGVYRLTGGEETPSADIKAAWLSLFPKKTAYERLSARPFDAVVTGRTAAVLLGGGDFYAYPYCFIAPDKKTTKRQDIELISAPVDAGDVLMIETLPVACIERTVVDLLRCNEDESLVCDFLRDMLMRFERPVDQERLAEFLSPLAQKRGFTRNDGAAYAQMLIRTAFDRSARKGVGEALRSLMDKYREYSGVGEEGYDFFNDYILAPPGAEETGKGER